MTLMTRSPLDAVEHLPPGSTLILTEVSWAAYEQLLSELGDGYGVRVGYDRGRLEVMSPSAKHEKLKELMLRLADSLAEELDCDLESFGSTTFKREGLGKGAEPDTCFYVQNAPAVAGKDKLDAGVDPPPDVVVEIDVAHSSAAKLAFYESLGVPELWIYDGETAFFYHLSSEGYVLAEASLAFPVLTSVALGRFMAEGSRGPQRAALKAFRHWLRAERKGRS
jgi:Uma2 family endonuclease